MRKVNSIQEAIADYERITGETLHLKDGEHIYVSPFFDFVFWAIQERDGVRYLWLGECYGKMANLAPYLHRVMKANNLYWIVTATSRSPKIHERKWKMEHLPEYDFENNGKHYHVMKGNKDNLKG